MSRHCIRQGRAGSFLKEFLYTSGETQYFLGEVCVLSDGASRGRAGMDPAERQIYFNFMDPRLKHSGMTFLARPDVERVEPASSGGLGTPSDIASSVAGDFERPR